MYDIGPRTRQAINGKETLKVAKKVIISGSTFPVDEIERLSGFGVNVETVPADLGTDAVLDRLSSAWGYVLGGAEKISESDWSRVPELAVACFLGTGWESFMRLPKEKSHTAFCYTPHANAEAVAEFSLGLLIDVTRKISSRVIDVREGRWNENSTSSLIGSSLGIVGMGHVGRNVAKMFSGAFGGTVYYWNRTDRPENHDLPYVKCDNISEACEKADNVIVCLGYVPGETDGLIGAGEVQAVGSTGSIVNAARAELIAPQILYEALKSDSLGAVAIDGYYTEPTPLPSEDSDMLLQLPSDKVLVTPHCAYLSSQAIKKMSEMATDNLIAVAEGNAPPFEISK